jgi:PAS domain S-box-containing protein
VLRFSRNLFGMAALALVAIAATVGAMYVLHEGTASWVATSREVSRLARTTYVATVERQLALIDEAQTSKPAGSSLASKAAAKRLDAVLDSLVHFAGKTPERAANVASIQDARKRWLAQPGKNDDLPVPGRLSVSGKRRFDVLRSRISLFVLAEDTRYSERQNRERTLRLATSGAILFEVLVLLLVLNGIRNRLVEQATEVLQQKESLERQAQQLEVSNAELAAAIEEKERARALVEEEAAEQQTLFNAITEVFFVIDRDGRYHKVAPTNDELLARSREELLGRRVQEVLPAPIAALALSSISKVLRTGKKVEIEYPLELRGRTVWFAGTVNPLSDDKVLWVLRDISYKQMAAEAIKES